MVFVTNEAIEIDTENSWYSNLVGICLTSCPTIPPFDFHGHLPATLLYCEEGRSLKPSHKFFWLPAGQWASEGV